jgi:hypothetical protein
MTPTKRSEPKLPPPPPVLYAKPDGTLSYSPPAAPPTGAVPIFGPSP